MSLDANKQTIRDFLQAVWGESNLDALPDFWTADCLNHAIPTGSDPHGLDTLHAYHAQLFAAFASFSDVHIDIVQQVAEEDRVVTHLVTRARHTGPFFGVAPTGRNVSLATIRIDRLQDGKIAEHWSVTDTAGLVGQLQA